MRYFQVNVTSLVSVTFVLRCSEFKMGSEITDQQVGCLWQDDNIMSVSMSGYINYLDLANPTKPRRILKVSNSVT